MNWKMFAGNFAESAHIEDNRCALRGRDCRRRLTGQGRPRPCDPARPNSIWRCSEGPAGHVRQTASVVADVNALYPVAESRCLVGKGFAQSENDGYGADTSQPLQLFGVF